MNNAVTIAFKKMFEKGLGPVVFSVEVYYGILGISKWNGYCSYVLRFL